MTLRVVVEADGGSRGNPGPAGFGAVVRDAATDAVLAERAGGLGRTTNNVAEYQGLIAGLRAAAELRATTVDVRMDSKLVVEQMSGRWKIKHPQLQPLALEARNLAREFDRVSYEWIPRARNSYADRLANEAMDAQAAGGTAAGATASDRTASDRTASDRTASNGTGGKAQRAEQPAASTTPAPPAGSGQAPAPPGWTGAMGTPTRMLLLRHGQTELSAQRRYSGRGDVPLTELGRGQATAAAKRLAAVDGVAAVVSSPLVRARQTAQVVAEVLGVPVSVHEGLIETDFGEWEGLTFAEAIASDPQLHRRWLGDPSVPPPGGESFEVVHRRVRRARDELITRYGGATVLLVSHVTPIKALLRMALDAGPSLLYRLHLDLASLSVAEFYPDGNASVRLVNDTSHLPG